MSDQPTDPTEPQPAGRRGAPDPMLSAAERTRLTQRVRRGLAALSLVGAVLVALPVAQLMRYQSAELQSLSASRASLDPVARAVHVQRGLLAHRELAGQVLRGQERLEADRKLRQGEVDGRMAALNAALAGGRWDLALGEAGELRLDWLALAHQVLSRQIDAPGSDQGHRLLVEQTLQVMDLVSAAVSNDGGDSIAGGAGVPAATMAVVRTLPRLTWITAQLGVGDEVHTSAALQRRLIPLEAALARTLGAIESGATDLSLAPAAAAAGAASDGYFALLRDASHTQDALRTANQTAVLAQMRLFDLAHGLANATVTAQARAATQKRSLLLGGICAGVLIALVLVTSLRRDLLLLQADDQQRADGAAAPSATDGRSGHRGHAEQLLQRLRDSEAPAVAQPTDQPGRAQTRQ